MWFTKKPEYFDVHSHLNFAEFNGDREQIIDRMDRERVWTTTVGTDLQTSQEAVTLADKHKHLFATIGLHPASEQKEVFDEKAFESLVTNPNVVAIGECGLDYARIYAEPLDVIEKEKARQKDEFEKQIEFAIKHNKPLMLHCRDAYPDCLAILQSKKKQYGDRLRGNFHFFTSPLDLAKQCLELGFSVSFTGPITFVPQYESIVAYVPLEQMMVETDAPYAAPVPHRGKRNEPLYVKDIVRKIAQIKDQDLDSVREILTNNAISFFGIKV